MTQELPHKNCYRVAPQLIAGEYPGAAVPDLAQWRIAMHLDAGITSFLDLTEVGALVPYEALLATEAQLRQPTVRYQRMSIEDGSIPQSRDEMEAILNYLDGEIAAGQTVYLHCWGGIGRTGTVVGCWLVRRGMRGEDALATLARHWQGVAKRIYHPHSPETQQQRDYILRW
ncbi:dual specificity protein phosphatase family protein [Candidatus Chloroploca sp. Khr17]|uniref:protein-tyrosine phosphatase family protein n=1 Tax=Candidatus Chloroploca sp. Khr17 TaxID=2496869 RepID=UPI00101E01C9|nr:dual specificity protein phosphatase family protein [Candidatus Chloroploca sp. Khr17]